MKRDQQKEHYVKKILDFYLQLPQTPLRFSRTDVQLADQLYQEKVSLEEFELAMILATVRRCSRRGNCLGPIRSLHYFLPVLEEIRKEPLPQGYQQYLRKNLQQFLISKKDKTRTVLVTNSCPCEKDH